MMIHPLQRRARWRLPRRAGSLVLIAAPLMVLSGCAAAVPVLSAASTGAAAGQAGYSFWRSGKLTYVDEGSLDEMNQAVAITIYRFDLLIDDLQDEIDDGQLQHRWWSVRTNRGHLLTIKVEPLTDAMIEVELDVGFFGNKAAAELLADRFKQELDQIQAGPEAPADPDPEDVAAE